MMKRVSDFEKKYSLLAPYVTDEATRTNMLSNDDLLRKYSEHLSEISAYVQEIASRFDIETVFSLLKETVFKYPDEVLSSFIKAYLSSSEASKNNPDVVKFYNKTLHLGEECIHYIERKGIITNRQYRDLPVMVVDEKYNQLATENVAFKEEKLDEVYKTLDLLEKKLVIELLRAGAFSLLGNLFAGVNVNLKYLLILLVNKGLDTKIINQNVASKLGEYELLCLLYGIFEIQSAEMTVANVHYLLKEERWDLLRVLISNRWIPTLSMYSEEALKTMSDSELIEDINKKGYNLIKKDE